MYLDDLPLEWSFILNDSKWIILNDHLKWMIIQMYNHLLNDVIQKMNGLANDHLVFILLNDIIQDEWSLSLIWWTCSWFDTCYSGWTYIHHHIHNQIEYVFITNMMNTYIHLNMMINISMEWAWRAIYLVWRWRTQHALL